MASWYRLQQSATEKPDVQARSQKVKARALGNKTRGVKGAQRLKGMSCLVVAAVALV